jgi:hypothetical protein
MPIGAERHRVDAAAAQGLTEQLRVCRVGDIPQPDRAVEIGGGQDVAVGAERHRIDAAAAAREGLA